MAIHDKLRGIMEHKAQEVASRRARVSEASLLARLGEEPPPRGFAAALMARAGARQPAVIAEVKRASPSRGRIHPHEGEFDPAGIAVGYARHGATCLSCLTDERFFQGHDAYVARIRREVSLPVLRKDFLFDPYQVLESRALGADAVLLIMAVLSDAQAAELDAAAEELHLDVLVEVHDEAELDRAHRLNSRLMGVNNRDLRTFETHLGTTLRLAPRVEPTRLCVAESGIETPPACGRPHGCRGLRLPGGRFPHGPCRSGGGPGAAYRGGCPPGGIGVNRTRIKICGITRREDLFAAADAGADAVGLVFYAKSVRHVDPTTARTLARLAPPFLTVVGLFVNAAAEFVAEAVRECRLDMVQFHGDETPQQVAAAPVRAIRALRVARREDLAGLEQWPVQGLLLDAKVAGHYGGTGIAFDWSILADFTPPAPLILAGGLTPDLVADAVARVRPWAVDVSSGVEASPGIKDREKIRRFVDNAHGAASRGIGVNGLTSTDRM
ncbi:MAG: phosphoribosylanthranilate isomerase [Magnetococcus sp. WYHC-3]